jgi:phosphoribulokinase
LVERRSNRRKQVGASTLKPDSALEGRSRQQQVRRRATTPLVARDIPTADESFLVIWFANTEGYRLPIPTCDAARFVHIPSERLVAPAGKMELAMQLIFPPFIRRTMDRRKRAVGAR